MFSLMTVHICRNKSLFFKKNFIIQEFEQNLKWGGRGLSCLVTNRGGQRTEKIGSAPPYRKKNGAALRTSAPAIIYKPISVDYNSTHWTRKMNNTSNRYRISRGIE